MTNLETVLGICLAILLAITLQFSFEKARLADKNKAYIKYNLELQEYKDLYDKYGIGCEA